MSAWGGKANAWAAAVEEEEEKLGKIWSLARYDGIYICIFCMFAATLCRKPWIQCLMATLSHLRFPLSSIAGSIQAPAVAEAEFPSLGEAVTVKETKKKKKQTMSLGEFVSGGLGSRRDADLVNLPTAPRGHVDGEEGPPTLGGGFRGYGGDRYGGGDRGGGDRYGDRERRPRRDEEDEGPSRADMANDWGSQRKFIPSDGPSGGFGGRDREPPRGGFRDRERGERDRGFEDMGPSRADMADDWGSTRQFAPSSPPRSRRGGFGGGFEDRPGSGYREGRERVNEPSRADLEDKWERRADVKPTGFDDRPRRVFEDEGPPRRGLADGWRGRDVQNREGRFGGSRDVSRDATWRRDTPSPGAAEGEEGPKERPKLVLKPRSTTVEANPAAASAGSGEESKRASVFGAARPREEVLKQQGRDPLREDEILEQQKVGGGGPPPPQRKQGGNDGEPAWKKGGEEEAQLRSQLAEAEATASKEDLDEAAKTQAAQEVADLKKRLEQLSVEKSAPRGRENGRPFGKERGPRRDARGSRPREGGDRW
jgi:hypothetical protein